MAQLEVLNPVAPSAVCSVTPAKRLDNLSGKTIGLYWNIKSGGDVALARIAQQLKRRYPDTQFRNYIGAVGAGTRRLTQEQVDEMAATCQGVIGTTAD